MKNRYRSLLYKRLASATPIQFADFDVHVLKSKSSIGKYSNPGEKSFPQLQHSLSRNSFTE